jgi:molybdenum cofactor guanylyltransferase
LTAAILAGGENRRMPVPKAFLLVEDRTIMERSIEVLGKIFDRILISTNMPERYFSFGLPMVGDVRNARSPMTGILSVLIATREDAVFVVACDMPFLNERLIRHMKTAFEEHTALGAQVGAVVPERGGNAEPLFGIYTRHCIATIEEMLARSRKSLIDMFNEIPILSINEEVVKALDPGGMSFVNVNTFDDYERIGGNKGGNPCLA